MRERRWESRDTLDFHRVLALGDRLAALGLSPAGPAKDIICYIEEWMVETPDHIDSLDPWPTEDVTLVQIQEDWQGDFFLLAGGFHTVYKKHQAVGTYCSVSHPWRLGTALQTIAARAMFWLGFRHAHGFIRVRLQTNEVITPGETRGRERRSTWLDERRAAFDEAIRLLDVPLRTEIVKANVAVVAADPAAPLFCSWPDAFGPCQFEYNSSDAYEFLVPASRLAATYQQPSTIRAYLTGFSEPALQEFQALGPAFRSAYRCSVHCPLDELPEVLAAIAPTGRLYATLCEFQAQQLRPDAEEASAIIGIVGADGGYRIEVRLNRAPLREEEMAPWLEALLDLPVVYAPLPAFP